MSKYQERRNALAQFFADKIRGKTALMHKRIADVSGMYADEERSIIKEAEDTASKFGVRPDNDEGMARVLDLVLGAHGIDTAKPAPLFTECEGNDANGRLAQAGNGPPEHDQEERAGSRNQPGEEAGGEPGQRGGDGAAAQSCGKRSRRKA